MKDSFGSAYMIYVFIFFVIIFITFISLILKYAQAFKVKDQIISIIEEYEGYGTGNGKSFENIESYIESTSYRPEVGSENFNAINGQCSSTYKYCIAKHSTGDATYYTVYTFVSWNFPFFKLSGVWNIQGETRPVVSNVVQDYS